MCLKSLRCRGCISLAATLQPEEQKADSDLQTTEIENNTSSTLSLL